MIIGIGTDIVSIDRIKKTLTPRFLDRCFAPQERVKGAPASRYARRWAAKEACAKALGLGIRGDIILKDIIVTNDRHGKPGITLKGGAKERLTHLTPKGMTSHIHVSLSDEPPAAVAFVVIAATPARKASRKKRTTTWPSRKKKK